MGGSFTSPKFRLLRLNADGTLDDTFNPSTSIPELRTIDLQADGKVLAGGAFTVRRLLTDGPADPTWTMGNVGSEMIEAVAAQPDGKVIIGGDFGEVNGVPGYSYLARLNSDGSLDTGFHPDLIASVQSVALQSDGKILAGGLSSRSEECPVGELLVLTPMAQPILSSIRAQALQQVFTMLAFRGTGKSLLAEAFHPTTASTDPASRD